MATRSRNRQGRALLAYVNGKRADFTHGMADRVGRSVRAVESAARKTVASTRRRAGPIASRDIRAAYNLRAGDLRGRVIAESTRSSVSVYAHRRRIPLVDFSERSDFAARWGGARTPGASVEIIRGQREVLPSTFIRRGGGQGSGRLAGGGRLIVFQRWGHARTQQYGRYKGTVRQPIRALYGPSLHDMIHGRIPHPITRAPGWRSGPRLREKITEQVVGFAAAEYRRLLSVELGYGQ